MVDGLGDLAARVAWAAPDPMEWVVLEALAVSDARAVLAGWETPDGGPVVWVNRGVGRAMLGVLAG